jgi:hypothetical protein
MSENSESLTQPNSASSSKPNPPATPNKKISTERKTGSTKKALGKTNFRLSIALDRAVRLASVLLEEAGEEIYLPSQIVEYAVKTYMEHLQNKKGMDFQGIIVLKSAPSTKPSSQVS